MCGSHASSSWALTCAAYSSAVMYPLWSGDLSPLWPSATRTPRGLPARGPRLTRQSSLAQANDGRDRSRLTKALTSQRTPKFVAYRQLSLRHRNDRLCLESIDDAAGKKAK